MLQNAMVLLCQKGLELQVVLTDVQIESWKKHVLMCLLIMVLQTSECLTKRGWVKNDLFDVNHPCTGFKVNRLTCDWSLRILDKIAQF